MGREQPWPQCLALRRQDVPQLCLQPSQEKRGHPGKAAEVVDGGGDGVDSLTTAWEGPRCQIHPSVAPAGSPRDRPHLSDSAQASRQGQQ